MDKKPYTDEEDIKIRMALSAGAGSAQDVCFETELDYMKVMEWFGYSDNAKEAERLCQKPLWLHKKKVMAADADSKWLLTHHRHTKKDWGDRQEIDVDGELKLKDMSDEELKERAAEIIGSVLEK